MRRLVLIVVLLFSLSGIAVAQSVELSPDQIDQIARSVVTVAALKGGQVAGIGSGTIINSEGLIFTNHHVIAGSDDFLILMLEDISELPVERFYASVVGVSDTIDLAVLQIDRDLDGRAIDPTSLDLPVVPLADSRARLGEDVAIFGYPGLAEGYLVFTDGTISSVENANVNGERIPLWYQTDAEISPGNSGGLAVNEDGEMIGIPTAVAAEGQTGGRLGGILALPAILSEMEIAEDAVNNEIVRVPGDTSSSAPSNTQTQQQQEDDDSFTPPSGLDYNLTPNYGETDLQAGFQDDPFGVEMEAGGDINTAELNLGSECTGYATSQPDFRLQWSGSSALLRFFFVGEGDTTLLINDPNGDWWCNDDSFDGQNPTIDIENPPEGQYDIWVASYNPQDVLPGILYITEQPELNPTSAGQ